MALAGYATIAKACLAFGKKLGSLGISPKPLQNGLYPPLCMANYTSLTRFYGGFFFFYGNGAIIFILPNQ
jgi:hypothetical protein